MKPIGSYLVCLCAAVFLSPAQEPSSTQPQNFEVASVKPMATREVNGVAVYPGGRVALRGSTLQWLIQVAYHVHSFQVSGGPEWTRNDRYDIDAKPPASSKSSQLMPSNRRMPASEEQRQMLQSLLAERFQLKCHREVRNARVYLLMRTTRELRLLEPKDKNTYPGIGGLRGGGITTDGMTGQNLSMADLAWMVSPYFGRPVLDRTGVAGRYDFRSEYDPGGDRPDAITVILSSLKGIGLKLQSSGGSVETIVIDHAAKPTAN